MGRGAGLVLVLKGGVASPGPGVRDHMVFALHEHWLEPVGKRLQFEIEETWVGNVS